MAAALLNPEINENFELSQFGLIGLAVMGQNFALNVASRGVRISVQNRSPAKVDDCVQRANNAVGPDGNPEDCTTLRGFYDLDAFIQSIERPRPIMLLVKAGKPVQAVIDSLLEKLEPGDMIIDGGNEWYVNSEDRIRRAHQGGIRYLAMGVSGGEKGARYGPSLMPGGDKDVYDRIQTILEAAAAIPNEADFQLDEEKEFNKDPCVTFLGPGGFGNYVKMVHNGIEYGDMQLIAEAYDLLKNLCNLSNEQLAQTFAEYYADPDLKSFLIEITAKIFEKRDDLSAEVQGDFLVDKVMDQTGSKGTGMWTVKEMATQGIAGPTISAALNARYISSLKGEREAAEQVLAADRLNNEADYYKQFIPEPSEEFVKQFVQDVRSAMYASKICSYAQGMNLIKAYADVLKEAQSEDFPVPDDASWPDLGNICKIWRAGCIIRANFLNDITAAYQENPALASLLVSDKFSQKLIGCQQGWRNVVSKAVEAGIPVPAMSGSLAYYDSYRRGRLPANLTQAQRDFFGAHTYARVDNYDGFKTDKEGQVTDQPKKVHSEWSESTALIRQVYG